MSDRADMKHRVRGLLRRNWLEPLCALALAVLPVVVVSALVIGLLRPNGGDVSGGMDQIVWTFDDPMTILVQLLALFSDPMLLITPLLGWMPLGIILLCIHVFFSLPLSVSVAGYFRTFLRHKEPKPRPTDVYASFSGRYPRALGGMAYMLLWQCLWLVVSFVVPTALIFGIVPLVSVLGIELSLQIYIFIGAVILGLLWYVIFFFVFLNRMLAYSLTPVCLAAQPLLPARRAVRLSRKLMRGCKWQLIGLLCSFLLYFIPALVALAAILLIGLFGGQLGMTAILQQSVRTFLWVVVGVNQLAWAYVGPYMAASVCAFYLERKHEALMDEEVTPDDFAGITMEVEAQKDAEEKG